ncbi:MAG: heme-binding protein [Candidatus Planktophila sp.]|nr:heme-binding protein [Candidatus Planktophila sp.]
MSAHIHKPELSQQVVLAGINFAKELGLEMTVALVDASGNLVSFARTERASMAAIESVAAKARTAIWFGRPTAKTVEAAEKRPVVYTSIMGTSPNKLVLSMGGELLYLDGEIVGAIASAGASGVEDIQVSQKCVEIWKSLNS